MAAARDGDRRGPRACHMWSFFGGRALPAVQCGLNYAAISRIYGGNITIVRETARQAVNPRTNVVHLTPCLASLRSWPNPPNDLQALTELLGLLAYGQLQAFDQMAADARLAPDLAPPCRVDRDGRRPNSAIYRRL